MTASPGERAEAERAARTVTVSAGGVGGAAAPCWSVGSTGLGTFDLRVGAGGAAGGVHGARAKRVAA